MNMFKYVLTLGLTSFVKKIKLCKIMVMKES